MEKVGKDMHHCIWDLYGVLGCFVCLRVGFNVEGKGKDGRVEKMRLKNLGGIKYEGGLLLSFVAVEWYMIRKFQYHRFPLWYVIFVLP